MEPHQSVGCRLSITSGHLEVAHALKECPHPQEPSRGFVENFAPRSIYLGYVSPRLSDVAAEVSEDYVEAAGYVKLIRPEGEIDFVAASNLTNLPFEIWHLLGREIKVETSAEIVAKKLWHRGHTATARDLFDLALVIEKDSENLKTASEYLKKHRAMFLGQLKSRQKILESQFNAINALNFRPTFTESFASAQAFLNAL